MIKKKRRGFLKEEKEIEDLEIADTDHWSKKHLEISQENIIRVDKKVRYSTRSKRQKVEQVKVNQKENVNTGQKEQFVVVESQVEKVEIEQEEHDNVIVDKVIIRDLNKSNSAAEEELQLIITSLVYDLNNIPLLNRLEEKHLRITDVDLGEGQFGIVRLSTYQGIQVACKLKRPFTSRERYIQQSCRELQFAAKLSICRYINRYIGWIYCRRQAIDKNHKSRYQELFIVQPYIQNRDARSYLSKKGIQLPPSDVLKASICLFSALTDAHTLNIGIVDLKLENFLLDSCGSGWLTDFGSCIEFKSKVIDLDEEEVSWTKSVAAPEMIRHRQFLKASDVFMATLIIAELMTSELNDEEFSKKVLRRKPISGEVSFSHEMIDSNYSKFFKLLKMGLSNEACDRPDASTMLKHLLNLKV